MSRALLWYLLSWFINTRAQHRLPLMCSDQSLRLCTDIKYLFADIYPLKNISRNAALLAFSWGRHVWCKALPLECKSRLSIKITLYMINCAPAFRREPPRGQGMGQSEAARRLWAHRENSPTSRPWNRARIPLPSGSFWTNTDDLFCLVTTF